jgi:hypothetical protein
MNQLWGRCELSLADRRRGTAGVGWARCASRRLSRRRRCLSRRGGVAGRASCCGGTQRCDLQQSSTAERHVASVGSRRLDECKRFLGEPARCLAPLVVVGRWHDDDWTVGVQRALGDPPRSRASAARPPKGHRPQPRFQERHRALAGPGQDRRVHAVRPKSAGLSPARLAVLAAIRPGAMSTFTL